MKSYQSVILLIMIFMIIGCSIRIGSPPPRRPHPPVPEYPADQSKADFDTRINAAKSLMNFVEQDNALSTIALDAANEYNLEYTIKALSMISNFVLCDNTAEKCAILFMNENMIEEATIIADEISNFVVKDRVLSRIAQSPAVR